MPHARATTVPLAPDLRTFIEQKIRSGEYATAEEVVRAGLAMLQQQAAGEFRAGELDALIAEGEESIRKEGLVSLSDSYKSRHQRRVARAGKST